MCLRSCRFPIVSRKPAGNEPSGTHTGAERQRNHVAADTLNMTARAPISGLIVAGRSLAALLAILLVATDASSQIKLSDLFKKLPSAGLSEADAGRGIKEALAQGVTKAVLNLHKTDGFFGSEIYKVLLPPDARKAESTLRRIGFGSQVDKAVLAIN